MLSTIEPVQLPPSVIFNLYVVPFVHLVKSLPLSGNCGIPWTEPVCVTVGIVLSKIDFEISSISMVGLLAKRTGVVFDNILFT